MPALPRLARGQEHSLEPISRSPNGFLESLSAADFELLRPHLRTIELVHESTLLEVGDVLKQAYFPHSGVISLVVNLEKEDRAEVGMIGRDSVLGALAVLGDGVSLSNVVILMPGTATIMGIDQLRIAADQSCTLRTMLVRHGQALFAQAQQSAGCNASHTVESRLARWLLRARDLSGSDRLLLTQELMAQMIGARRNSVSQVANALQQASFIRYSRGHIEITNLDGLRQTSCGCYRTVKGHYERLLNPGTSSG
jgi:CRP-like cAMP-binding protein